jgi:hypothetical protein
MPSEPDVLSTILIRNPRELDSVDQGIVLDVGFPCRSMASDVRPR